mmetsp:Transcript_16837/g.25463  ORF Transcript_16837/g.25463 Transcript_16837/m.25463 type:complete len:412 (-) Transcript_16837:99-1334(-)|eukprot:CAMPEP_0178918190 /NCGR_PEP_ID=MMETSP0786-20121207/13687_1 /TAXON_ID=186022 /ORGANISM="Thalassionema frauenfeldii, Strain CCMP 1798" /LENGTH=411 /DNA_ID=CAMNT_0020591869 /DNA_START=54 /DNA_END=1289 /DNA_ORIENTATION=+
MATMKLRKQKKPLSSSECKKLFIISILLIFFSLLCAQYLLVGNITKESKILQRIDAASLEGTVRDSSISFPSWCSVVDKARSTLNQDLHVKVPCETMKPAKSAVVVFLTAGLPDGKGKKAVFTATDYFNGVLALGASLNDHLTRRDTHRLLLLRDGFTLHDEALSQIRKIGWTIGTAPDVKVDSAYIPRFERYKTLYTKTAINGLSEYECVLLLDADTLVVGNIDQLMSCEVFDKPHYRAAGTLDYYRGSWYHFNTGSTLWKPSSQEMNRVYQLTKDPSFMKRFESDQIFTNTVYPDRTNKTLNNLIMEGKASPEDWGQIVDLGWEYNAQTHVEYEYSSFWEQHKNDIKIIHFTQRKGWQCVERHGRPLPIPEMKLSRKYEECVKEYEDCACKEGYRWWDYLDKAKEVVKQ